MRWLLVLLAASGCGRFGFDADAARADASAGFDGDGPLDGAVDDDAPPATCAGALLCEGFEDGFDTAIWSSEGTVTIDTSRAHRGAASVRVATPALNPNQNAYSTIWESTTLGAASGTFWVRGWYWLAALPAGTNGMELVVAGQQAGNGDFVFVFRDGTHLYSQFSESSLTTPTLVPVGRWFCVVMKVVRSTTTTGTLVMSGDDLPTLILSNVQTDGNPPLDYVGFGIGFASGNVENMQPALELWIDDILVDDAPIACAD